MSSDGARTLKSPRPSAVTLACVFVAVTAFLTLTEVSSALMDWGTVTMQDGLKPVLEQFAGTGIDVTMAELLRYLRWFALAMVPFAVSTMVFAVYAFRGDRMARVMTTVLAIGGGIVSLPIGVFGIIQAVMLFVAAGALWTSDSSRWFRGEPAPKAPRPLVDVSPEPPVGSDATVAPPAVPGAPLPVPARPTSVMAAGLLAILGSVAAAGFAVLWLIAYSFQRDEFIKAAKTGPFSDLVTTQELELGMQVLSWASVAALPLAVAGILGGVTLLARRRAGRTAMLVWAWSTALFGVLMLPLGLVAIAGAGTVIVLLRRDEARQWTSVS